MACKVDCLYLEAFTSDFALLFGSEVQHLKQQMGKTMVYSFFVVSRQF